MLMIWFENVFFIVDLYMHVSAIHRSEVYVHSSSHSYMLDDDNGYNEHALVLDELFDVISMFDACVCLGHFLIFGKHVFLLALICLGMLEYDLKHVWMMIIA